MPPARTKTASLVRVMLIPTVAQAAWLSLMATRRRPNGPRRSAPTPMRQSANTTAMSTTKARSVAKRMPKMSGRPTFIEPFGMIDGFVKKRLSIRTAKASVASAM